LLKFEGKKAGKNGGRFNKPLHHFHEALSLPLSAATVTLVQMFNNVD
jgi:hypothetical protein